MKAIDLYYHIKPLIPRSIQISARRAIAVYKRKKKKDIWPIDPNSAGKPEGWKGWPENKKFAFVLQHDVDTEKGVANCARIAEIEKQLNFRSSFNFVPEDYLVPRELRESLRDSGFEVGVHGLKHDGKLFKHAKAFFKKAPKIQYYLKEWGASGFTSPSMLRNLSLMAELDIEHGCSTFDTDPFEPQSDGIGMIFPFHVSNSSKTKTYVELPYTLPQDHCLFVILREKDTAIWKEKIDWIAKNGGMAALNTHPDYMNFDASTCPMEEYPAVFYKAFLQYIQTKYAGQYWNVLPREMARFWKNSMPSNGKSVEQKLSSTGYSVQKRSCQPQNSYRLHKKKIWIDLDNTPHVPFFIPIIKELELRGYQVLLTARDAFQVCDLATAKGLAVTKIGHHYGKNSVMKIIGLFSRAAQLLSFCRQLKPDIALSHGARSQILLCNALSIPTILIADYEHSRTIPIARPRWLIVPEALSAADLSMKFFRVRYYPGIKEDVYVPSFEPNPSLLDELGLHGDEITITVRPPADEAHYYNPESDLLLTELMSRICQTSGVRAILLPRNQHQANLLRSEHPEWFVDSKTIVPARAVDGLNLLWYSDLVVSGGGTMNREAAALGVTVYSIFRGKTGAVDNMLERERRLTMIRNIDEVWTKIRFERRKKDLLPDKRPRPALSKIIYNIENIIEIEYASAFGRSMNAINDSYR